jgi:hypothetical protein
MNNGTKISHLTAINRMLSDHMADIGDRTHWACKWLSHDNAVATRAAVGRMTSMQELLREMAARCNRMADEIQTLKGN